MTTINQTFIGDGLRPDALSGDRAGLIDRWIYVFTAASFVAVVLIGFIPDSVEKIGLVQGGKRPPFPLALHLHALLMGAYLVLLLTQTVLAAIGRLSLHRVLGLAAMVLAPALVVAGFILVPTLYHAAYAAAQAAAPQAKAPILKGLAFSENVMLLQIRIGIAFGVLVFLGLRARATDPGFHKRMMILSIAVALPAAFNRIGWIPSTMPASPVSPDLYVLLAISPLFLWDLYRNRRIHRAYWVWLAVVAPLTLAVQTLYDTPFWHALAKRIMGV